MTDIGLENEDWLRAQTWDVWKPDYSAKADTLDDLRIALDCNSLPDAGWRNRLQTLVDLPFWEPAPQKLKDEAAEFLAA